LIYGVHAFCFCPLVTILDHSHPLFSSEFPVECLDCSSSCCIFLNEYLAMWLQFILLLL
jgi:hypothetical protein